MRIVQRVPPGCTVSLRSRWRRHARHSSRACPPTLLHARRRGRPRPGRGARARGPGPGRRAVPVRRRRTCARVRLQRARQLRARARGHQMCRALRLRSSPPPARWTSANCSRAISSSSGSCQEAAMSPTWASTRASGGSSTHRSPAAVSVRQASTTRSTASASRAPAGSIGSDAGAGPRLESSPR